jgi:hypothetical protein
MTTPLRPILVALTLVAAAPVAAAQSDQHHHAAAPSVSAAALKQVLQVKETVSSIATPEAARAAGFEPVLGWIPMMGTHWVHGPRMLQGRPAATLTTPSQLMFSQVNGKDTLVGVAYAYYEPTKDAAPPPVLFDGGPAWHDHPDLAPPGTNLLMLHAWFVESPDGPFAGMNPFLPYWAAGVTPPAIDRMRDVSFSTRVRKGALALAEVVQETGLFPVLARRPAVKPILDERRAAIRTLIPQLNAARSATDPKSWDSLLDALASHFDVMRETYLASALDPNVRTRIAKALDDMINGGH